MKRLFTRRAALLAALALATLPASAQYFLGGNLGSPGQAGSVSTNTDGSLAIAASGNDIWNSSDNGYYYSTWVDGTSWEAVVRVKDLTVSSQFSSYTWAKAELMVRASDPSVGVQGNDAFIATMATMSTANGGVNTVGAQYRAVRNTGAANAGSGSATPSYPEMWLKLTRTNSVFTVQSSANSTDWTLLQTIDTAATANGFGTAFPNLVTVGIAVTAHSDNQAAGEFATATCDNLRITPCAFTLPTQVTVLTQVQDVSTYANSEISFAFKTSNNGAPVPLAYPNSYQWYKNGAAVSGATMSGFTWLAQAADAGSTVYCVSTLLPPFSSVVATSAVGHVTAVNTSTVDWTGGLKLEVFPGSTRPGVYAGAAVAGSAGSHNAPNPGTLRWLSAFEDGGGYGDNTARRVTGYFIPWTTGNYTFYVAGDDDTDVFLSTDASPANMQIICQEPGWSGYNNWVAGGDPAAPDPVATAQKCSDTWTNGSGTAPNPSGIALTAGQKYFLQAVLRNGGGGDNLGVTAKLFNEPAPTNGAPTTLTAASNNIALVTWQATTLSWTTQPTNIVGTVLGSATFYARATSDGELTPHYQWYRNGTAIAGATASVYTISPLAQTDSGSSFYCIATEPTKGTITSTTASLNVTSGLFEPGFAKNEKWFQNDIRTAVENGTAGLPDMVNVVPAFEAATNTAAGDNYTRRVSGMFIPPATGDYVFFTASDDQSDLFISTDSLPAHKYMIAQETQWNSLWNWTANPSDANPPSILSQKRSDQWTNAAGQTPYSAGIRLQANQQYYMEVVQHDGTGGDHVAVTYKLVGEEDPVNGTDTRIKYVNNNLGFYASPCSYVSFTLQPTNPPAVMPGGASSVTFYAQGVTDSQYPVGDLSSNPERTNQFVFFQWQKNGVDIPGASSSSYTFTGIRSTDNNAQFRCKMRALGYGTAPSTRNWSNSQPATLSVITDTNVPQVISAGYIAGTNFITATNYISLTFSYPLDPTTLTNPANYTIPGCTVLSVNFVSPDYKRVLLEVDPAPSFPVTVTLSTALRTYGGVGLGNTSIAVSQLPAGMGFVDIGAPDSTTQAIIDPLVPSKLWIDGPNAYTIAAMGSDIWNNADGFTFLYQAKSGDFDVVLRQTTYTPVDRWAKVGLMAREDIDQVFGSVATYAQSRNWNVVNDPPDVTCLHDGNGANAVECNWRPSTGAGSTGWATNSQPAPTFPNAWVRLKRAGQTISAFAGSDGVSWYPIAFMDCSTSTNTTPMPNTLYVGIAATSHWNSDPTVAGYNIASVDNLNFNYVQPAISPRLSVSASGGNLTISWAPLAPGHFMLQQSATMAPGSWTDVANGGTSPVIVPMGAGPMFYSIRYIP